jgi:hypothetical protein
MNKVSERMIRANFLMLIAFGASEACGHPKPTHVGANNVAPVSTTGVTLTFDRTRWKSNDAKSKPEVSLQYVVQLRGNPSLGATCTPVLNIRHNTQRDLIVGRIEMLLDQTPHSLQTSLPLPIKIKRGSTALMLPSFELFARQTLRADFAGALQFREHDEPELQEPIQELTAVNPGKRQIVHRAAVARTLELIPVRPAQMPTGAAEIVQTHHERPPLVVANVTAFAARTATASPAIRVSQAEVPGLSATRTVEETVELETGNKTIEQIRLTIKNQNNTAARITVGDAAWRGLNWSLPFVSHKPVKTGPQLFEFVIDVAARTQTDVVYRIVYGGKSQDSETKPADDINAKLKLRHK